MTEARRPLWDCFQKENFRNYTVESIQKVQCSPPPGRSISRSSVKWLVTVPGEYASDPLKILPSSGDTEFLVEQYRIRKRQNQECNALTYAFTTPNSAPISDPLSIDELGDQEPPAVVQELLKDMPNVQVDFVQKVTAIENRTSQYVVALKDGSHVCTCLLRINLGLPCKHFMAAWLKCSRELVFHPSLFNARWIRMNNLGDIALIPCRSRSTNNYSTVAPKNQNPFACIDMNSPDRTPKRLVNQKRVWAEVQASIKPLFEHIQNSANLETVLSSLETLKKQLACNELSAETVNVLDPLEVRAKGRPRTKRLTSATENVPPKKRASGASTENLPPKKRTSEMTENAPSKPRICGGCGGTGHYRSSKKCPLTSNK